MTWRFDPQAVDLVWVTVHHNPTNTKDLKELEDRVIAPSYEDYERYLSKRDSVVGKLKSFIVKKLEK